MRDRFPLLVAGALLLTVVAGAYLFQGAKRGRFADVLSTWRSEPDGARALFLLAQESGLPVGRHQTDLEVITEGAGLALLSVYQTDDELSDADRLRDEAPDAGGAFEAERKVRGMNAVTAPRLLEDERKKLLEHIAEGHTLLYVPAGESEDPLLDTLGIALNPVTNLEGVRHLVPPGPSVFTWGVERAQAEVHQLLLLPWNGSALLVDEQQGGTVMGLVPWGKGQVVVISAPELAMNKRLAEADNAQLWLSLLTAASTRGPVLFDEFHHGFSDDRSMAEFARRYGLHFAILQLLLGLSLWTVAMRRFGRPSEPEENLRVGSTDALFAASRIYREGRHHGHAAGLIARGLTQELAQHAGLPVHAHPPEVAQALRARNEPAVADALETVGRTAAAATTERDVEHVAREAAELRQQLHGRRHAPAPRHPVPSRST